MNRNNNNDETQLQKPIIENILVSGYLREYEQNCTIEVPHLVTSVISVYCKEYCIKIIGSVNSDESHKLDALTASNVLKNNGKEFNIFISNTTTGYQIRSSISSDQIDDIMTKTFDELVDIQSVDEHTLFLTKNGKVYGIGTNECGQLGLGPHITYVDIPTLIPFKHKIKAITTGKTHSLFLNEDGKLLVCGYNYCGQLGIEADQIPECITNESDSNDSDSEDEWDESINLYVYTPIFNSYFDLLNIKFIAISCGEYHSLCITTNGECFTFGHNGFGNLGNGKHQEWGTGVSVPYKLEMNVKFKFGSCGNNHNILLTANNQLVVFGNNREHQCSIKQVKQFDSPHILTKENEFDAPHNFFIEKVICNHDKSRLIVDIYKRAI